LGTIFHYLWKEAVTFSSKYEEEIASISTIYSSKEENGIARKLGAYLEFILPPCNHRYKLLKAILKACEYDHHFVGFFYLLLFHTCKKFLLTSRKQLMDKKMVVILNEKE